MPKFSGLATRKLPKLYVVSLDAKLIYVGITRQSMRARFRGGFTASGKNGYHGYAWRHSFTEAVLDIWCHEDAPLENSDRDIETVEAEVVFLARRAGQWPECPITSLPRSCESVHPSAPHRYDRRSPEWRGPPGS
jgi:hypothetical protein